MNEFDEEINSDCTLFEPEGEHIAYCAVCDVAISLPDWPAGRCGVCDEAEQ